MTSMPQFSRSAIGTRIAAARIGVTVAELEAHEAAGERWCPRCRSWRTDHDSFRSPYCRPCARAYQRSRYVPRPRPAADPAQGCEALVADRRCGRPRVARGLCRRHYDEARRELRRAQYAARRTPRSGTPTGLRADWLYDEPWFRRWQQRPAGLPVRVERPTPETARVGPVWLGAGGPTGGGRR